MYVPMKEGWGVKGLVCVTMLILGTMEEASSTHIEHYENHDFKKSFKSLTFSNI